MAVFPYVFKEHNKWKIQHAENYSYFWAAGFQ